MSVGVPNLHGKETVAAVAVLAEEEGLDGGQQQGRLEHRIEGAIEADGEERTLDGEDRGLRVAGLVEPDHAQHDTYPTAHGEAVDELLGVSEVVQLPRARKEKGAEGGRARCLHAAGG